MTVCPKCGNSGNTPDFLSTHACVEYWREATGTEIEDWLSGYVAGRHFRETEHGLEIEICSVCIAHPGWAHGDVLRRREPADTCRACLGSGIARD